MLLLRYHTLKDAVFFLLYIPWEDLCTWSVCWEFEVWLYMTPTWAPAYRTTSWSWSCRLKAGRVGFIPNTHSSDWIQEQMSSISRWGALRPLTLVSNMMHLRETSLKSICSCYIENILTNECVLVGLGVISFGKRVSLVAVYTWDLPLILCKSSLFSSWTPVSFSNSFTSALDMIYSTFCLSC